MTAPNLKNPASIVGMTTTVGITTTSIVGILTNPPNSNKVLKINSIYAANVETGGNSAAFSLSIIRNGVDRYLARAFSIPLGATQIITTRETYFYLEENVGIRALSVLIPNLETVPVSVDVTISYEEISL